MLEDMTQTRVPTPKAWELDNGGTVAAGVRDSSTTLTGADDSTERLNSLERLLVKTPLYSSDTRLMEFVDSSNTLTSEETGEEPLYQQLMYPKNKLHQSDTRLLHPSQIELKSTNYFTRPPLSCSSLEEEPESDYGDYVYPPPPTDYLSELGAGSRSTVASSRELIKDRPQTRRACIRSSDQSLQSPDGSYFSIDSNEDDDFNLYENIAALKIGSQMISSPHDHMTSQHASLRKQSQGGHVTTSANQMASPHSSQTISSHDKTPTNSTNSLSSYLTADAKYGNHSQIFYHGSSPKKSSELYGSISSPRISSRSGDRLANGNTRYPRLNSSSNGQAKSIISSTNNNVHHISNGSSAYGSGSLAVSKESDIDTFL